MKAGKKTSSPLETLAAYLRESGQRLTSERIAVMEVMLKHRAPFTIEEILARVEKESFPIARATVYNTMTLLTAAGVLDRLRMPVGNTNLYILKNRDSSHVYYICSRCGKVKEASVSQLVRIINDYDFRSFNPHSFALSVYGLCSKCARADKKSKTTNNIQ